MTTPFHDALGRRVAAVTAVFAGALLGALSAGCRTVEEVDQRTVRAEVLTRASSWDDASSIWGEIYRDSRGSNRRAGVEASRAHYEAGRPGVARTRLLELDRRWPGDVEIIELLGMAHERADDPEAAREAYMRVLQLDRTRPHSLARLGVLTGDVGAANGSPTGTASIAQLRAANALDSVGAASLLELGFRAATTDRPDQAFLAFDAAVESGELSLAQQVEAAAAIAPDRRTIPWLRSVVQADPQHTRALTLLGEAQLASGLGSDALRTLEQAASSDPSDPGAMRAYAAALTQTGQAGRAREILDALGE